MVLSSHPCNLLWAIILAVGSPDTIRVFKIVIVLRVKSKSTKHIPLVIR